MESSATRRRTPMAGGQLGTTVTRWAFYGLFFLLPILFLPWTTDVLELNKQTLLVLLSSVAVVAWLGSMVMHKRLSFRSGLLNLFPFLFLVAVFLSSLFSLAGFQTWVGQASQEYMSFLSVVSFVLLFYALANMAHETEVQTNILFSLFLSSTLAGLIAFFGMLNIVHLPFAFAQSPGFNTVGTLNGLLEFMAVVMFLGLALWLVSHHGKTALIPEGAKGMAMRVCIVLITLITMFAAVAIDFWVLSAMMVFGVLVLGVFHFLQTKAFPHPARFLLPILVLIVSLLLLFFSTPVRLALPVVVSPGYGLSWDVTRAALSEDTTRVLFGTGPGTFGYDYAKYKPVEVNNSVFWNVRFDRAKSYMLTAFASLGVVGLITWLLLVLTVFSKSISRLVKRSANEEWKMTYVFFVGWAVSTFAHMTYSSNMTLQFLFWGLTGLLASQVLVKVRDYDFDQAPRMALLFSFAFVLVGVGVVASLFVSGQRYAAEIAFAQAVRLDRSGAPTQEVIQKLASASSGYVGAYSDVYYRNLSSALLLQARNTLAELDPETMTNEQLAEVQSLVGSSINAAVRATELAPNEVSNWIVRGTIYRDVMNFVTNAEDFAAATFEQAIALEPVNPSHHTNLGRVHLAVAERARALQSAEDAELAQSAVEAEQTELAAAEEVLNRAIELKADYAPAHFYLAATFERQGRLEEATTRMAALRNVNPSDVGLAFQLSLLLLRLEEYDLARQELERIVALAPEYSNALWFLGSAYEIQGDQQKAINAIQKVLELNPDNQVVSQRLSRMQNGEITTLLPGDLNQPIEAGEEAATDVPEGEVVEGEEVPDGEVSAEGEETPPEEVPAE